MANELHTFTGNEVIATELPELLNQNFNYIQDNSLATVNGVEKDENNNVDVTFLTSQVIPTNSDLNNFRESGEYTRELDTIVVANSPTEKPFFLTVLASENLVKQVVTEIDRKDPMTFTRTLSGANWSPWVEGGVDIGIWKSEETVKVGDVRFLKGRENAGYVLECVKAGVTGESQPEIEITNSNEVANYAEVGRVGQVRVIFNLAEKDVDEVMAMGITYSRLTYPELWEWAGKRAGLIISEEEWQAKFAETNGKFVPYYSSGDGSSTFRTPLLGAYLKGAENSADVGKWLDAGLPNIEGQFDVRMSENGYYAGIRNTGGCFYNGGDYAETVISNCVETTQNNGSATGYLNASRSNSIYGNSDTVTPETMTGIWVIKAVGVVVDSGETDIAKVLQGVEQVQRNYLPLSGGTMTGPVASYVGDGTLRRAVDNSYLEIWGGSDWTRGAYIHLRGADHPSSAVAGGFVIAASKDGTVLRLEGNPNGNLTWDGNTVEVVVAKSLNTNGYIKFSSGLIIQWGKRSGRGSNSEGRATVTFPISFNVCLNVSATQINPYNSNENDIWTQIESISASSFTCWAQNTSPGCYDGGSYWFAIGY